MNLLKFSFSNILQINTQINMLIKANITLRKTDPVNIELNVTSKGNVIAKTYLFIESKYSSPNVPTAIAVHWNASSKKSFNEEYGESANSERVKTSA